MTKTQVTAEALSLSVEDQLDLAQALWENASPPAELEISPELKGLLEARLAEARENPEAGIPWEEVKERLLRGR